MIQDDVLIKLVHQSFVFEVSAFKPGNVSKKSAGHGMEVDDFLRSADVSSELLVDRSLGFGERIFRAAVATREAVGCNTNLGMLLLFAPLIVTVQQITQSSVTVDEFAKELNALLDDIDLEQSLFVYRAIEHANPGGLGGSDAYDVRKLPKIDLLTAMKEAELRDRIAWQYTHGFDDLISRGLQYINGWANRWNSVEYAVVFAYVHLLCDFTDTHIERKYGKFIAQETRMKAVELMKIMIRADSYEETERHLSKLDNELKNADINPGTTADLTAASILLYLFKDNGLITID